MPLKPVSILSRTLSYSPPAFAFSDQFLLRLSFRRFRRLPLASMALRLCTPYLSGFFPSGTSSLPLYLFPGSPCPMRACWPCCRSLSDCLPPLRRRLASGPLPLAALPMAVLFCGGRFRVRLVRRTCQLSPPRPTPLVLDSFGRSVHLVIPISCRSGRCYHPILPFFPPWRSFWRTRTPPDSSFMRLSSGWDLFPAPCGELSALLRPAHPVSFPRSIARPSPRV